MSSSQGRSNNNHGRRSSEYPPYVDVLNKIAWKCVQNKPPQVDILLIMKRSEKKPQ
jgi:hypothetical protein